MRIGSVTDETNNSSWEVYANYKRTLQENQENANLDSKSGQCHTCDNRTYKDGSGDPGVSFKTPTKIDPSQAASSVRGHEMEHVVRNQAKAQREDRKVVSQSVTYQNGLCPECGRTYIAGGTTRTVTKGASTLETADTGSSDSLQVARKPILDRYA